MRVLSLAIVVSFAGLVMAATASATPECETDNPEWRSLSATPVTGASLGGARFTGEGSNCAGAKPLLVLPQEMRGAVSYQEQSAKANLPAGPAAAEHRFWDKENDWLFAAVGGSRALDYSSTLNFRRRGRDEWLLTNDIVDNHAGFAAIEAGATAVSVGASYLFHHYHHHRLERWTSIVHASVTTGGAVRNYCLKTAHN